VISVANGTVRVLMQESSACGSCSQQSTCSPGSGTGRTLLARDPVGVKPGQVVTIDLPEGGTLKALGLAYGIPLLMLLVGAGLGHRYAPDHLDQELVSALSAFAGLGLSFVLLRRFRSHYEGRADLTPTVIRIGP